MESSSSERVEIPATFEDAPVEHLVQLIGMSTFFFIQLFPFFNLLNFSRHATTLNRT